MPLILGANSVSGYTVKNSIRTNQSSADYLTKTFSSSGNLQKNTLSFWFKLGDWSSGNLFLFSQWSSDANSESLTILGSTKKLNIGSGLADYLTTNQVFRDPSAWYHLIVAVDTTQATASNRMRIYLNGSEITSFSTDNRSANISQNSSLRWGVNAPHNFFYYSSNSTVYNQNSYLSETYFIDGQQLTPSSFGETDTTTGIWIPKAYTGSYGTNGFFLKFASSSSLGTDSSGNGNNFTVNNLTSVDQSADTPTNNFCTLNPLDGGINGTFSNGNLELATSSSGYSTTRATFGFSAGKWYWEGKLSSGTAADIGINTSSTDIAYTNQFLGYPSTGYAYSTSGNKANNNTNTAYGASYTTNDIIGIAFDADSGTLTFYKNGVSQGIAFTGLTGNTYLPAVSDDSGGSACTWQMNFGYPPYSANGYTDGSGFGNFSYAVPSGYYALCSKNLALYG